jgi:hypothetical protein
MALLGAGRCAGLRAGWTIGLAPDSAVCSSSGTAAEATGVRCEIAADSWKAAILASSSERKAVADAATTRACNFARDAVIDGSPARPRKENPTTIATAANIATAAGSVRFRLGRRGMLRLEVIT